MSKLGKKPISVPKDTKVKVEKGKLFMTGPKGSKELTINIPLCYLMVVSQKSKIKTHIV